jgi:uncharacterized protein (TIGR02246 family)
MKKVLMIFPLAILFCFTFGCQQGGEMDGESAVDVEADVEAIKALLSNNALVISSEDLDGWLAQFTNDAIFMNPNAETLKGTKASRQYAQPFFEQFDNDMTITVDEIEVYGDWAFARWSFTWEFTPKAGGDTMQEKGKEIWILKRQADNSWKCSHIIWNTDNPSPVKKQ